jgi:Putative beta-lactamase-inhibitor-like, PepSY-like
MKIFKITGSSALFFIFFCAVSLISCEKQEPGQKQEQEQEVTVNEVPLSVKQAFDNAYPGAEIKEYSKELEDGKTYYEVACVFEGRRIDVLYHPDGSIAAIEEVVATDMLPEAVKTSMTNEFKGYSINLAEKVQKEGKVFYELKIKDSEGENRQEVLFSESGQIVEKSGKSAEHEEEDEESEDDD